MKMKELQQRTEEELAHLLAESRKKMRELRFNLAAGKVKNIREIKQLKVDIARILTLLRKKKINKDNK